MPGLFDPLVAGELHLPHRIILAPLTRSRAGIERQPNALMAEYYTQRASAGLMISEATSVSPMGVGYADTPGIWSTEQTEGWKLITRAVHAAGGQILLQLWHVGRVSHPMFLGGQLPVAPSAIGHRQPGTAQDTLRRAAGLGTERNTGHRRSLSPGGRECSASRV